MVEAGDPMPEGWRDQVLYGDAMLGLSSRQFAEEIAGMRFVTRKAFWLALDAEDAHTYLTLVEVYGRACITLVKLLRSGGGYTARVHAYLHGSLETVLEEFALKLNSDPEN
jgi:hypothetical protein